MRILLADDFAPARRAVATALRMGGIVAEVIEVADGLAALQRVADEDFDCVFLDLSLPEKSGLAVLREIRASGNTTPVIITTGDGSEQTAVAVMKAGATDYLSKAMLSAEQVQQSVRYAVRIGDAERKAAIAAQELRRSEQFNRSVLNALPAEIAVLDRAGVVVFINRAWELFNANEWGNQATTVGANYLDICQVATASGDMSALNVAGGIVDVLQGRSQHFSAEYSCHSPEKRRWFLMHAVPLQDDKGGTVIWHINITERREAEQALRESESRLAEAQQLAKLGAWDWDVIHRRAAWSDALFDIYGLDKSRGAPTWEEAFGFLSVEDRELAEQVIARAQATGEPFAYNHNITLHNGSIRSVDTRGLVVKDERGRVVRMFGTSQDVTERYYVDRALRESEARFRRIFDANIVGVYFWGAVGRITDANGALLEMLGYSAEELRAGRLDTALITPPEYRDRDLQAMADIRNTGACRPYEKEFLRKDGTRLPVYLAAASLAGKPDGGICLVVDLTQQKHTEEERRQSSQRFEVITQAAPAAIYVLDLERTIQFWNLGAERVFGWTLAEVIGKKVPVVQIDKAEEHFEATARVYGGAIIEGLETTRARKDGRLIDVSISAAPLRDREGRITGLLAICVDVTARKRMEEQLIRSQRMESIGRLAGGVAHDFNNILAIIGGYSEGLLRRFDPVDPMREHVEQIEKAAERQVGLTQQLLTFSRGQDVKLRPLDLNEVARSVHTMLSRVINREIRLELKTGESLAMVLADAGQIEQVLMNLTLNARDAMPRGGRLTIETANVLGGADSTASRYVRLSVIDTGQGMDEATRSHIFEPFFTTKERKGTGLGLWIVYGIVERCGGSISVRSKPGEGTTFELLFPAQNGQA